MSDLNLYDIHHLDRSAPSPELAAQLTAQLNAATEQLARQRIDAARAILGDPQRRQAYDAQLADPQAPPITEATLAVLAGRPAPAQAKPFAQPRVLAVIAAALGVLLIVVISAVACSGGNDGSPSSTGTSQTQGSATTEPTTAKAEKLTLDSAQFDTDYGTIPTARLKVVGQDSLAGQPGMVSDKVYLTQPDEQTVRAYWNGKTDSDGAHTETWVDLAIGDGGTSLTPNGQVRSEKVALGDNVVGKPVKSGARKGVPDPTVGQTSGVFLFAAGAPGKVTSEAPEAQRQDYREVLSAFQNGDHVYVTVWGFPGVLIAELEKAQN